MNFIAAFINNPVKVAVGVLVIALFGVIALLRMPMQLTPEVQIPTITVETKWPGASPQEVEREIVHEQEEQLKAVEGVVKMSSESMDSQGRITLEFGVGTDIREALLKVNTRLQQVPQYPVDADEPVIVSSNADDRPIAWFNLSQENPSDQQLMEFASLHPSLRADIERIRATGNLGLAKSRLRQLAEAHPEVASILPPEIDVPKLRKFAEDVIESRFERVDGVSNSNIFGGEEIELQVIVDPQKLAARKLTIQQVRQALQGRNKDTSGGDFWEGKRRYVVRTLGQFRSPEQVESVIVTRIGDQPVYMRDVAEVGIGYKKPTGMVRRYGSSNIAINCARESGANVLEVMDGIRAAADELNAGILHQRGLRLSQVYDETEYILSAIELVKNNIYIGGILTVAVLLLFLRSGRSTLVIGLAIPTSILGAFIALGLMGRSLNVISLAGLAFAVGMLVDNAIVVLENIYRLYQGGRNRVDASVRGTQEVWGAVLASTLTTLAVFIPVLFVEEEAGQLFRDIALAISAGIGLSLIVSISVIPTATSKILSQNQRRRSGRASESILDRLLLTPTAHIGRWFVDRIAHLNRWLQRGVFVRLATVIVMVGASIGLSYLLFPSLEYLPSGNRNLVFGILLPPAGYNLDEMREMGQRLEKRLQPYWEINAEGKLEHDPDAPAIGDFFFVASGRRIFMGVRAVDPLRAGDLVPILQQVASHIPGTIAVVNQSSLFEQGLAAGRTVDIEITGPDLHKLVELGGRVLGQVRQILPNSQARPNPSLDLSTPEVHVLPKWEQAADMGVTAADMGYAVDALVDGAYAGDYYIGGDKIDLTIIGNNQFVARTQDLENLPISTPMGDLIPLAAVANVQLSSGPEQINHRERQRAITIQVTPPLSMPLETAMTEISKNIVKPLVDTGELGETYRIELAGTADKLRATWRALRFNVVLALFITYLLMAGLFESWLYPFVIILSVPLGAVGGIAALALLNLFILQPLDVLTMLGFVILIGTVVNNPILIVHQALNHMGEGMTERDAVVESVRNRIRPIFMTTVTTVLGLAPLVFSPGAGSELYRGLGAVVLGGLLVSTIFTVVLVPVLFTLAMEAKAWILGLFRRRVHPEYSVCHVSKQPTD